MGSPAVRPPESVVPPLSSCEGVFPPSSFPRRRLSVGSFDRRFSKCALSPEMESKTETRERSDKVVAAALRSRLQNVPLPPLSHDVVWVCFKTYDGFLRPFLRWLPFSSRRAPATVNNGNVVHVWRHIRPYERGFYRCCCLAYAPYSCWEGGRGGSGRVLQIRQRRAGTASLEGGGVPQRGTAEEVLLYRTWIMCAAVGRTLAE